MESGRIGGYFGKESTPQSNALYIRLKTSFVMLQRKLIGPSMKRCSLMKDSWRFVEKEIIVKPVETYWRDYSR